MTPVEKVKPHLRIGRKEMSFGAEAWKRKLYEAVELIQRRVMTRI